jgi:uncharacterized protein (DUF952 family)
MELHHVLTETAWAAAQATGIYAPPELAHDGFLHCCTSAQLGFVLARHFEDATGLLVLTFETDMLAVPLRWVNSEPDMPAFPHLYGPIPIDAVKRAEPP